LPDDGQDIGSPAIKGSRLIDDRRTAIRWHDLDLMVAGRERRILRRAPEGNILGERLSINKDVDGRRIRRGVHDTDGRIGHAGYCRRRLLGESPWSRNRHRGDQRDDKGRQVTDTQQTRYGVAGKPLH
jgi:hypothetical protein